MALYDVSTSEKKASPELVAGGTLYADNPLGTILPFGSATIPTGWLLCDGTAISRTTYSELFAVIGTAFGSGDGSTTFNLPDMRESVPKGAGLTGKTVGAHLDADGLAVGEFLDDRVQAHTHNIKANNVAVKFSAAQLGSGGNSVSNITESGSVSFNAQDIITGRSGATTEVKSVGVNYIIKAKMTAVPSDFMSAVDEAVEEMTTSEVTSGSTAPITSGGVYASTIFYKTIYTPDASVSAGGVAGNNISHGIDESKFTVIGGSFIVSANVDAARVWGNVHAWSSGGKVYYTYHSDIAQTVGGTITLYYVAK